MLNAPLSSLLFAEQALSEAAKTIADAESSGLGLLVTSDRSEMVLFNTRATSVDQVVVGMFAMRDDPLRSLVTDEDVDTFVVERSAAKQGYGPLLYEIAMSMVGWLAPDQETVSDEALGVWQKFFNRPDVTKSYLGSLNRGGRDNPRNYTYKLKTPVNYKKLQAVGDDWAPAGSKRRSGIRSAADDFFDDMYQRRRDQNLPEVLTEAAKSVDDAVHDGLGLVYKVRNNGPVFVLFKTADEKSVDPNNPYEERYPHVGMLNTKKSLIQDTRTGKSVTASVVEYSAAERGYGPLLYEIAMSVAGWLAPDRETVSSQAKTVWQNFFNRSDVDKMYLGSSYHDIDAGAGPVRESNPLNYAYKLKSPVSFGVLEAAAEKVLSGNVHKRDSLFNHSESYFDKRWREEWLKNREKEKAASR